MFFIWLSHSEWFAIDSCKININCYRLACVLFIHWFILNNFHFSIFAFVVTISRIPFQYIVYSINKKGLARQCLSFPTSFPLYFVLLHRLLTRMHWYNYMCLWIYPISHSLDMWQAMLSERKRKFQSILFFDYFQWTFFKVI